MDSLITATNDIIDNLLVLWARLLEIPAPLLWVVVFLAFVVLLFLASLLGRVAGKKWHLYRRPALLIACGLLAVGFVIDQRLQLVLRETRGIRSDIQRLALARAQPSSVVGGARSLLDLVEMGEALTQLGWEHELHHSDEEQGGQYLRIDVKHPSEIVVHLAAIHLLSPGLEVRITPSFGDKLLTSAFAESEGCFVAINGEAGLSPAMNSGLGQWTGNWIVRGEPILLEDGPERPFLSFDTRNRATYFPARMVDREVSDEKYNTIWGRHDLLVDREVVSRDENAQPRTCMGIDESGARLFLLVADGRRPGHSLGISLVAAGRILRAAGATDAMSCDQGGSSCMYLGSLRGIASTPSDGFERPTYSHFGVRVPR